MTSLRVGGVNTVVSLVGLVLEAARPSCVSLVTTMS